MESWLPNALFSADAALLVIDIRDPVCSDHIETVTNRLAERNITLSELWPDQSRTNRATEPDEHGSNGDEEITSDVFHSVLPTALVANKIDLGGRADDVQALKDLLGVRFPALSVSAKTNVGLDRIAQLLFDKLEIVRVYTKVPGGKTDQTKPFAVRKGDTVLTVAKLVHRDVAAKLSFARAWGSAVYDGQQVGPDYEVSDGDTLEIHTH
jgi:50S ribosomal subunit-associated GTPase HflX